ncbi:MAG TPA: DUF2950 domain-containing protein [Povalibacter sp.]|uniref:DUF2950 domain-containing protein n=1 Tax=Povalibacter sp. TaxID=1962978 RepID=UPI002BF58B33|nr:DUF2950 domain-containing protein [Povalibacter sp.]HMN45525.1 DUF2950 domain-containing protein [Povalibacter sp.]
MRTAMIVSMALAIAATACSRVPRQHDFATVDDAVQALIAAARTDDTAALLEIIGSDAASLVESGDPVQDRNGRERFVQAYEQSHRIEKLDDGSQVLDVGEDQWPFPFPLVQSSDRWRFDSSAGVEEMVNRRVGANELATIQSCLAFIDAEREYYSRNPQRDPLLHFAQKLVSTAGQKDGLYWPTTADEEPSPLGEQFATARGEGYFAKTPVKDQPYHGYVYRLLSAQGPHAAGGAYDYLVRDRMLGGFALIAVPAEYGSSGVMTFMVSHDGVVYSKDLGSGTPQVAMKIDVFDPDPSWKREAAISDQ